MDKVNIFWMRRDLRLFDNHALSEACKSNNPVLPLFIFDDDITSELPPNDPRISFIYDTLLLLNKELKTVGSSIKILQGNSLDCFKRIVEEYEVGEVYTNEDYEPYAIARDKQLADFLKSYDIGFHSFKDQVIFSKNDILKSDGTPYTVFTPYKKRWLDHINPSSFDEYKVIPESFLKCNNSFPSREQLGFVKSEILVRSFKLTGLDGYAIHRDTPSLDATSYLSPHLRMGTVSIRQIMKKVWEYPDFVSELVWREFFMSILYHFPNSATDNFKSKYDNVEWRNNMDEFEKWKRGETGYAMVDAGMRQLNQTGYMHNRVRMLTASFLCKHLLIDWRFGEGYFAEKLLDYEMSSNVGNWQWASGTGCDAVPYFRVFNPDLQLKKFDPKHIYVRQWVPNFESFGYPTKMVDHAFARNRAIDTYKKALNDIV